MVNAVQGVDGEDDQSEWVKALQELLFEYG